MRYLFALACTVFIFSLWHNSQKPVISYRKISNVNTQKNTTSNEDKITEVKSSISKFSFKKEGDWSSSEVQEVQSKKPLDDVVEETTWARDIWLEELNLFLEKELSLSSQDLKRYQELLKIREQRMGIALAQIVEKERSKLKPTEPMTINESYIDQKLGDIWLNFEEEIKQLFGPYGYSEYRRFVSDFNRRMRDENIDVMFEEFDSERI